MQIDLYRHGPKNNHPEAHKSGIEAILDSAKFGLIRDHARKIAETSSSFTTIQVVTTPLQRAFATGQIAHQVLSGYEYNTPLPKINPLVGSAAIDPVTEETVNLSPASMSELWGQAKKLQVPGTEVEELPLYTWFLQGLDNKQACRPFVKHTWDSQDPGISLREIGWRIGTFIYQAINETDPSTRVVAYGHSGDIETWLALTLLMHEGLDSGACGTAHSNLSNLSDKIGALEPLSGINILYQEHRLYLAGPLLNRYNGMIIIDEEIVKTQARLFSEFGVSNQVLQQKTRLAEK